MRVLRVSEDCLAVMQDPEGLTGEVHSVFDRAVNVLFRNGILMAIVTEAMDLAPMTAQVSRTSLRTAGWRPGTPVICAPDGMRVGDIVLDFSSAEYWALEHRSEANAAVLQISEMRLRFERFASLLLSQGKPEGLLLYLCEAEVMPHPPECSCGMPENRYVGFIKGRLDQFIEAYRDPSESGERRAVATFERLVGFGPGLTPSSDDFVAGFMAANVRCPYGQVMERAQLIQRNQKLVEAARGKTTVVSEALLIHAAVGHTALKYRMLLDILCGSADGDLALAVKDALAHGDTSGTDFLTGVATALMLSLRTSTQDG